MSGLGELLGGALGGDMMAKIAGQLNTDEAGAHKAVGAARPALLGKLKANADDPAKAEALAAAVNRGGSVMDDLTRMATGGGSTGGPSTGGAGGLLSKLMGMLRRK